MACAEGASPAPPAASSRVIDAHVHFYDPTRPQGVPWPSINNALLYKATYPGRYLASARSCQVNGVVAVEASGWLEDNLPGVARTGECDG
jgi:predicted TIM-barrel fold metal-dependent hydrolase